MYRIRIRPGHQTLFAAPGSNLLAVLRQAGLAPDSPCGGEGRCGKCRVLVDGMERLACQTSVSQDLTVTLPQAQTPVILTEGLCPPCKAPGYYALAFDIGTTTLAGCLIGPDGTDLAVCSRSNPQKAFGADVVSRIRHALTGEMGTLSAVLREELTQMTGTLCQNAGILPSQIQVLSIVGNPAMQQFLLGVSPENLARPPFAPVLQKTYLTDAGRCLPLLAGALLLTPPDVSGFVGGDTLGCLLATGLDRQSGVTLLVDIGTNGELVLATPEGMAACSTAAGPALEGAQIQWGMGAQTGAIHHVQWTGQGFACQVLGNTEAAGICGSGLIDAVAAALDGNLLDRRGKIRNGSDKICLTDTVYLTQEDIRQVQAAKGAIAAGIQLLLSHFSLTANDISAVFLAGAFGTYLDPRSACRIGLLPPETAGRITAIGNAALAGAKMLACDKSLAARADAMLSQICHVDLATEKEFPRAFAKGMLLAI